MNNTWKELIFIIACFAISAWVIILISNRVEQDTIESNNKLGKQVIVLNDTLMITDYSLVHDCYYLSNRVSIHHTLIDSLIIE